MRHGLWLLALTLLVGAFAQAATIDTLTIGFHVTPDVEVHGDHRQWDLSLSLGAKVPMLENGALEIVVMLDSRLTSLGTSFEYLHNLPDPFSAGGGLTILWPFASETRLLAPVFASYIIGVAKIDEPLHASAGMSFPLVTVGRQSDGWDILPPTVLPTIALDFGTRSDTDSPFGIHGRLTLQPVIVDAESLNRPFGRISSRLLVIPTFSGLLQNRL